MACRTIVESENWLELYLHHRLISWGSFDGNDNWREREPPSRILKDMAAEPHPPLPNLVGMRSAPVFGPGRTLALGPGYDASSEMYVWAPRLELPLVPEDPTHADIEKARYLLETKCLAIFPSRTERALPTRSLRCCSLSSGPWLLGQHDNHAHCRIVSQLASGNFLWKNPPSAPAGDLQRRMWVDCRGSAWRGEASGCYVGSGTRRGRPPTFRRRCRS